MTDSVPREDRSLPDPKATRAAGRWKKVWEQLKRFGRPIAAIAAFGAILSGLLGYWSAYEAVEKVVVPKSSQAVAPGPPAMSIAVLPFTVVGTTTGDESLAQNLTHDVIAAIARSSRYALVASYGSVAVYSGKVVDPRAAGRDLNVRYLAEGQIRLDGDKVVVAIQMTDSATATQVWSDRLDTTKTQLGTAFVAGILANRIRTALADSETRRAEQANGAKADALSLWLRGASMLDEDTLDGALRARKLLDESLQVDPKFVGALAHRVWVNEALIAFDPKADRDHLVRQMDEFSRRAIAADSSDQRAWAARASALTAQYRWNEALEALDQELRVDPNRSADVFLNRAVIMMWRGRPEDAFTELDKGGALDARTANDGRVLRVRCRAHLALGHYDDAIELCERAAPLEQVWVNYLYLTAAYAQKGDMSKAATAKAQLLKSQPGYTIERIRKLQTSNVPAYWEQVETNILPGLRKAGVPEQ